MKIDASLAQRLVREQFPQWANLPVSAVANSGWDNRTFHLGNDMCLRLPSDAAYAPQVNKEQQWLPKLAPLLPMDIPTPLAMGKPGCGYSWHWSVNRWISGETAATERISNMNAFATDLANFITSLHAISANGGPTAGAHNFYRGGPLATYGAEVDQAMAILGDNLDDTTVWRIWNNATASEWQNSAVWVHGDISVGNLLVMSGRLIAVIDFGCLGVGDPACDLVIAWTLFDRQTRALFRKAVRLDEQTWGRARGWALWRALIIYAELPGTNPHERHRAERTIKELVSDSGD